MGFPPFFKTLTSTISYSLMSGDKEEKTERTGLFKGSHIISVVLLAIDLHLHGRSQRHSRFSADHLKQLGVTRSTQHHVIHTTSGRHVNIGEALLLIHSGEASLESQNHFNRVLWRGKATRVQLHPVEWITRQLRSKTAIPIIERKTRKESHRLKQPPAAGQRAADSIGYRLPPLASIVSLYHAALSLGVRVPVG